MRSEESLPTRRTLQVQLIIWAGFVILLYYIHDHVWMENFRTELPIVACALWTQVLGKALWVAGFAIVGYGTGRLILDLTRISRVLDTLEDDIVFSVATGWGIIGLGAFLLGTLGLMQPLLHAFLAVALVAISHRQLVSLWKQLRNAWREPEYTHVELFLMLSIFTVGLWGIGLYFVPAFGPDAMSEYLPTAATYVREGQIAFHPELGFNSFPQTVQMWFMESMIVIPDGAAGPLMGACHLLAALAVFAMTRRFFGRGPALVATLVYLLMNEAYRLATMSSIDSGLNLMLFLGMYSVVSYLDAPSRPRALLGGLMLGFACGMHYFTIIVALVCAIVAVIYIWRARLIRKRVLTDLVLAAIVMLLICSAWYIRNIYLFSDPFFPFYGTAGGSYADIAADLAVDRRDYILSFATETARNPLGFLLLPFSLAFRPFGATAGLPGPWLLILLPLAVFIRCFPKILWAILGLIVGIFAWWWFVEGALSVRYVIPALALAAVVSGFIAWDGLRLEQVKVRGITGLVAVAVALAIIVAFFTSITAPAEVRGQMPYLRADREKFDTKVFPASRLIGELNGTFADEGVLERVRVYGYGAGQYRWLADFELVGSEFGYADHRDYLDHAGSAGDLNVWLKSYGVGYLLVNTEYSGEVSGEAESNSDPTSLPDWEESFEQLPGSGGMLVFRLK